MIVIYIIVAAIATLIITLIKAKLDDLRLDDLSMKRSRLSLNRERCSQARVIDQVVEISSDDSSDSVSDPRENVQQDETNRGEMHAFNKLAGVPSLEACTTSNSQHDASNYKDVAVNPIPRTFNKRQSMFSWGKTSFANKWKPNNVVQDDTAHGSRFHEQPAEACTNKRVKLMTSSTSSSSDDLVDLEDCEKETPSSPEVIIQREKMIGGVKVKIPVEPYPCQIGIMNSIILGCKQKQNCLLESPTGSGKTLALLCGVLAWQEHYSEEICKENGEMDAESSSCVDDESCEDNFFLNQSQYYEEEDHDKVGAKKEKPCKVPKIYYGTRTHKQIQQVVSELRKTAYRDKRMTILSSREHSCIQNTKKNKTELCNELLDPKKLKKCPYYNEKNKKDMSSFGALNNLGLKTPWDIEDLVSLGRMIATCPYFAARSLMTNAEIIFCPYNYIVDPNIRESMQINLKDSVVILDEAHNIEDICREVVSVDLRDDNLSIAAKECEALSQDRNIVNCHAYIIIWKYLADIVQFLGIIDVKDNGNWGEMSSDCWLGNYFRQMLDVNNVGCPRFPKFLAASRTAISDFNQMKEEFCPNKVLPTISRETKTILEHLCFVMQILTSDVFVDDYRIYVIESTEAPKKHTSEDTWLSTKNCRVRTMKMICMNPAIVFAPIARTVRSVILASGTLTPLSSFKTELGADFRYKPSLKHIISKEQIYVRCIPYGPTKKPLLAKFDNVNSFDFQDELGKLVLQVCNAVPYGVLCFFSSYIVMNKILARWRDINLYEKLEALKEIFVEPQKVGDLPEQMARYREVIKESSSISFRKPSGAIFFAVFRGKVAEGIDFKDNEARCVLAIGIPYSNTKNTSVSMKMKYNDDNQSKGLLTGSKWYTVNAFRALNQALGRCIRHKDDWGAVLLVDERFQQLYNINYLPNWIKSMWLKNTTYDLQVELEDFVALQVARERGKEYENRKKRCINVQN